GDDGRLSLVSCKLKNRNFLSKLFTCFKHFLAWKDNYLRHLFASFFRSDSSDDFFRARIAPERVPNREELYLALADRAWCANGDRQLLASQILIAQPGSNHGQILDHGWTNQRILFHRSDLDRPLAFTQCFFPPAEARVD